MSSSHQPAAPICVLGMSRSGTSFATRLIGLLGVDLGPTSTMLESAPDNPRGFWEQEELVAIDDELLGAFGGSWWEPPELPDGWADDPAFDRLRERAAAAIVNHFGDRRYVWKDPRACLTLPFWQTVIGTMDYVVCFRNPLDVAASLQRRNPHVHSFDDSLELWLRHNADALRDSRGGRRLALFYEDWFSEQSTVQLGQLVDFVLGPGAAVPDGFTEALQDYKDDGLRHHRHTDAAVTREPLVEVEIQLLWIALRATGGSDEVLDLLPRVWDRRTEQLRLEADSRSTRTQLEALASNYDALAVERDRLTNETLSLGKAVEREQSYRKALETSLSWRLTEPLRVLKRAGIRR